MRVVLVLDVLAALVALVLLSLVLLTLRRRLIQRSGGAFDCSLRFAPRERGRGWIYGVARYRSDQLEWFRIFSCSLRPRLVLERGAVEVLGRRPPDSPEEEAVLLADTVVLTCRQGGIEVELAMSDGAVTGFLAWLEAAPPGQHVSVA